MDSLMARVLDHLELDGEAEELTTHTRLIEALKRELRLGPPRALLPVPQTHAHAARALPPRTLDLLVDGPEPALPPQLREGDFRALQPNTDLRHALALRVPSDEGVGTALDAADGGGWPRPPRELRSSALTQCGDRVDFIAPAENMKAFFKLLNTQGAISLAVHRVGDTLVLEGLEAQPWARGAEPASHGGASDAALPLRLHRKALHSRFLTYSMGCDPARPGAPAAGRGGEVGGEAGSEVEEGVEEEASDESDSEREEWMPPREAPRGFRRVVRWQLGEISMLLGSDTVVFHSDEQGRSRLDGSRSADGFHAPGFSVQLHDSNSAATSMVCLDYWLDNVMSNAKETALCLHTDGVIQGYRVVPTDQLPSGCGVGQGFSPAAVTECAVSVLRFLQQHCTREGGTYWLLRPHGGEELQLFDITDCSVDEGGDDEGGAVDAAAEMAETAETAPGEEAADEAKGGGTEKSTLRAEPRARRSVHPFAGPVAMLCWRISERLTRPHEVGRRRRLLESCVALLEGGASQQMPMVAAAHEALSDGWELEAHALLPLPPALAEERPLPSDGVELSEQALAAIAAERAAVRALLKGIRALQGVCRPGATPPRLLRLVAKLGRALLRLAQRYVLARRLGRALAVLSRVATARHAYGAQLLPQQRVVEHSTQLLLLADTYYLAAHATDGELARHTTDLQDTLPDPELDIPEWVLAAAGSAAPSPVAPPAAATPSFAFDSESNFKLAIGHYLSALKAVPASAVRLAHSRLRATYSELGARYLSESRFTKACRHYQQGVELFRSTSNPCSAAAMCISLGQAIRDRLFVGAPSRRSARAPIASAYRLACATSAEDRQRSGGVAPDAAEMSEFERCIAAFAQAHELLGAEGVDVALWRQAEAEHAKTLLLQAERLEEAPQVHLADGETPPALPLLVDAAARFEKLADTLGAGDAHYRLGALHCRIATRSLETSGSAAAPHMPTDAQREAQHAATSHRIAVAHHHFSRALELLPADEQPIDHLLVRLDLVQFHKMLSAAKGVSTASAITELVAALRHVLATHEVFTRFNFPLPANLGPAAGSDMLPAPAANAPGCASTSPRSSRPADSRCEADLSSGGALSAQGQRPSESTSKEEEGGSRTCAMVASLWNVLETELHWLLKELVRLHGLLHRSAEVGLFKQLYRLSLTQRQLHGTGMLLQLSDEWARTETTWQTAGTRTTGGSGKKKTRGPKSALA
ncbi:hypothetical protein AB1Y20_002170 [Prymnesium parvum]|uniref:EDRF1 N-terminal domain-containing protein n=1 Tax=Prymnesium parvum TaxID=97485 RepID=A0AB34JAX0_PRYPA